MSRLIAFNKPYGVLTQFSGGAEGRATLADHITVKGVYPAGRLDRDSEGLLLLTDDGRLQARIAEPRHKLEKTYLAQIEGLPDSRALDALAQGVELKDGMTGPATVRRIDPPNLWPRVPPIRDRKSVPDCWIELTITEGRNRQVRRMTAAVGHPCLRLVRWQIGPVTLAGLQPGAWMELSPTLFAPLPKAAAARSGAPDSSKRKGGARNAPPKARTGTPRSHKARSTKSRPRKP